MLNVARGDRFWEDVAFLKLIHVIPEAETFPRGLDFNLKCQRIHLMLV